MRGIPGTLARLTVRNTVSRVVPTGALWPNDGGSAGALRPPIDDA